MATAIYPKFKQKILEADADAALNTADGATGVYAALIDLGTYTYSAAHDFYDDITGIVDDNVEVTTKTVVDGSFNGDDVTFSSVTGNSAEAIILYRKNGGASSTWPLIFFQDQNVTNLPVTPNGGDITITWDTAIFDL